MSEKNANYVSPNGRLVFQQDTGVVETTSGRIRGYLDGDVYTFLGVPYATAERFEEPRPVPHWDGVLNVQAYGPASPSFVFPYSRFMETTTPHLYWPHAKDSLEPMLQNLNIWTPSLDEDAKAPVIINFHAGGLISGNAVEQTGYHGKALSSYGKVVVITLNIRLGVLGFLDLSSFGERFKHSGNLGLMDFVVALNWIHENIRAFGGDPDNVTLFGHNIGQINLMQVPAAEGLFKQVVCLGTGSLLIPQEVSRKNGERMLEYLSISPENIDDILKVPFDELNRAGTKVTRVTGKEYPQYMQGFWPVLDGDFIREDTFGDVDRKNRGVCGKDIPMILGICFAEGRSNHSNVLLFDEKPLHTWTEEEIEDRLIKEFGTYKDEVVAAYRKAFPHKPLENLLYFDATSTYDEHYRGTLLDFPDVKAEQNGAPVYRYMFTFEFPTMGGLLAWHTSEIAMCMNNYEIMRVPFGNSDEVKTMSDMMTDYILAFARTGNPNHAGAAEWKPYTKENGIVLEWDLEPRDLDQHAIRTLTELVIKGRESAGIKSLFDNFEEED